MNFKITIHVSDWLADMTAMTAEEVDTASTLAVLEEKVQEFIAVNNGLELEDVEVTALIVEGNDRVEYSADSLEEAVDAEEVKVQIELDLQDFPWWDGSDIIKVM